jgi:hypothetical protein
MYLLGFGMTSKNFSLTGVGTRFERVAPGLFTIDNGESAPVAGIKDA